MERGFPEPVKSGIQAQPEKLVQAGTGKVLLAQIYQKNGFKAPSWKDGFLNKYCG